MHATTVGHLLVRDVGQRGATGPALRLRTERLLNSVDWRPPGLAPGAVLIVRRLAVVGLSEPDFRLRMAEFLRQAVRPAWGAPASTASSVLFSDEAELLACFTREVLSGQVWARWYWRYLWRELPRQPGAALAVTWSSRAAALPAALRQLSHTEAMAAVALLDWSQVSRVVGSLHAAFAVPNRVLAAELPEPPSGQASDRRQAAAAVATACPPWQPWLAADAAAGLAPQAHYLFGLAIALAEAPAYARSPLFAERAAAWLATALARRHAEAQPKSARLAASSATRPDDQARWLPVDRPHGQQRAQLDVEPRTAAPETRRGEQAQRPPLGQPQPSQSPIEASLPAKPVEASDRREQPGAAPTRREHVLAGAASGVASPLLDPRGDPLFAARGSESVATGLGGVLYLINWLRRLDLPAGWTDPSLAEHVSGWALLEALARALLGATQSRQVSLAADPLWSVLAAFDGRPDGAAIGAALPQPSAFRLPASWLRRDGAIEPRWLAAAIDDRLALSDVVGRYVIADVALAGRPLAAAAAAEAVAYSAAGVVAQWEEAADAPGLPLLDPRTSALLSSSLAWVVQRLLGFLRHWLARALACQLHELDGRVAALLAVEGRLVASRTHVDLYLSLDQIDLAARRAGLDRDPGWAPDLGRIVSFHFV